jgi:hypothetical protein
MPLTQDADVIYATIDIRAAHSIHILKWCVKHVRYIEHSGPLFLVLNTKLANRSVPLKTPNRRVKSSRVLAVRKADATSGLGPSLICEGEIRLEKSRARRSSLSRFFLGNLVSVPGGALPWKGTGVRPLLLLLRFCPFTRSAGGLRQVREGRSMNVYHRRHGQPRTLGSSIMGGSGMFSYVEHRSDRGVRRREYGLQSPALEPFRVSGAGAFAPVQARSGLV